MSQTSSPIGINEATADALGTLPQIGVRRAERILRYRSDVGPIGSADDLAIAAGISLRQAEAIANEVDWGQAPSSPQSKPWLAVATLVITASVVGISFLGTELDSTDPSAMLYYASVVLMLAGCTFAAADMVIVSENRWTAIVHLTAIVLIAGGAFLFAALALKVFLQGDEDALAVHVIGSWQFACFVLVVIALQLGPGIIMRVAANKSPGLARGYDLAQLPLAAAIYLLVPRGGKDSLMEEIFCLWAGMMFVWSGCAIATGTSSFTSTLSDSNRSRFAFVQQESIGQTGVLFRLFGVCLAAMGVLLAATAINSGWIRQP